MTSSADWFDRREWDGNHLHYFTISEVRRLAALNGLRIASIEPVGRFTTLKRMWPSLLAHEITFVLEMTPPSVVA